MTTIVEIPECRAFHLPGPGIDPLPLASGTLTLALIPANPPSHPSETIALSVGSSAFPVLPNTPVQKVEAKEEHPRYVFSPAPADGGAAIGRVKIALKASANQTEWESTEALVKTFEAALKSHGVWDERVLFVDDEWETSGPRKGWGETLAANIIWAGDALAQRLGARTDQHISSTNPTHPEPPSDEVAARAKQLNQTTHSVADSVEAGSQKVGEVVHDAGKKAAEHLPESVTKLAEPVPEGEKGEFRKFAEEGWQQATFAAKGLASAATTVAGAVSQNAHRAVEHNYGKEADNVAQDLGQSGANLGSAATSATIATSGIAQGANASSGVASAKGAQ